MSRRKADTTVTSSRLNPLIEELASAKESDQRSGKLNDLPIMPDGMSAEELALQAGRSVDKIRERLRGLLSEGRLKIGRKQSQDLMGRHIWLPCYKMVEPKK